MVERSSDINTGNLNTLSKSKDSNRLTNILTPTQRKQESNYKALQ